MSYILEALIGSHSTIDLGARRFQYARVVPLSQNMALIPLTGQLCGEIGKENSIDRFGTVSRVVAEWAQSMSEAAPVAYIAAEFFGGDGGQGAAVWSNGKQVVPPIEAKDAINQALRVLGVQKGDAHDEFDAIGLGQHRSTEDW